MKPDICKQTKERKGIMSDEIISYRYHPSRRILFGTFIVLLMSGSFLGMFLALHNKIMFKTDADIIIFAYIVYCAAIILFSWMTIMSVRTIIAYLRAGKTITLTDDMLILPVNNILGASRYYHIPYARISHATEEQYLRQKEPVFCINEDIPQGRLFTQKEYVIAPAYFSNNRQYWNFISELKRRIAAAHLCHSSICQTAPKTESP